MTKSIKLTRKQAKEIWKMFKLDKNLNDVTIVEINENGIGPNHRVEYTTVKDITDVETW